MKNKIITREHVIDLLKEFDELNGVSGFEDDVRIKLCEHLSKYTNSQSRDALGNCICVKEGKNKDFKIMFSAHMDEIGLIVSDISKDGYVHFIPVGMHNPNMLVNQVMTIHTKQGKVFGVVGGGKPIHQVKKTSNEDFGFKDLRLDVGATSIDEVKKLGIEIGNVINIEKESHVLNKNMFSGKAVDNRSGCVAMILAMELLKDVDTEASIYCCGTVQEEVGIKGAKVLARQVKPDIALALDVGIGSECDEIDPNGTTSKLGQGAGMLMYDWNTSTSLGNIVPPCLINDLENAAKKACVPLQRTVGLCCGTDAAEISLSNHGVITGILSIPNRYIHTTIGMINIDDVISVAKIAAQFAIDAKKYI